jgi:hypothetical protein
MDPPNVTYRCGSKKIWPINPLQVGDLPMHQRRSKLESLELFRDTPDYYSHNSNTIVRHEQNIVAIYVSNSFKMTRLQRGNKSS